MQGEKGMGKKVVFILGALILIFSYLTFSTATQALRTTSEMPKTIPSNEDTIRLVLITQELDTPFWNKVGQGAAEQAKLENVQLEVWGSYGNNEEDFLKRVEIALHSKVSGIIVQGLDNEEFKELTKVKAAFYGIPVITVANDVPVEESLRKTYIGSNQLEAGRMVAQRLVSTMGTTGDIIILGDKKLAHYQKERLQGIQEVLKHYVGIQVTVRGTEDTKEQVMATTQQLMNETPQAQAFIAINANYAGPMIQEIGRRTRVEPYHIYTFDDGIESKTLLEQGLLDGVLEQQPERMGKESVKRLMKWLTNETVPLDSDGYLTEIRMAELDGTKQ